MLSRSLGGVVDWPGEEGWTPPKTKLVSSTSHTAPQGHKKFLVQYKFWLGAYVKFQPVGWPG